MKQNSKARIFYAHTSDGWKIALHRHEGKRKKHPILMVHGLASNYRNMDFPVKDLSLARHLRKQGFDTWIVDLRGSGLSKKKGLKSFRWYVDDFIFQDLPRAIEKISSVTKAKKIHWIGHSLGGLLAYPFSQNYSKKNIIKSLITIAAPMNPQVHGYFKYLVYLDSLLRLSPWVPYKTLSKIATYFTHLILGLDDHHLFAKDNMDQEILRAILDHAVESVPSSLILQIHDWMRNNYFGSRDRKINYMEHFEEFHGPTLMITGSLDTFTPLDHIKKTFRRIPTNKKSLIVFGKKRGHENEYGHIDLIIGRNAPKEVFPHILGWLEEHDK